MSRIRPRLTYANVMVTLLAFVVLGGGAYATHTHKIGTKDLENGAVATKKVKKKAVKASLIANRAVKPRTIAPAAKPRWVLVQPDGTVAAQSGGIKVIKGTTLAGHYAVDFGVRAGGKGLIATAGRANDAAIRGVVIAAPCTGGPPQAYPNQACPGGNSPSKVEVLTRSHDGSALEDRSFYLTLVP